jgi:hypothetical protein
MTDYDREIETAREIIVDAVLLTAKLAMMFAIVGAALTVILH